MPSAIYSRLAVPPGRSKQNGFYGTECASFQLQQFSEWAVTHTATRTDQHTEAPAPDKDAVVRAAEKLAAPVPDKPSPEAALPEDASAAPSGASKTKAVASPEAVADVADRLTSIGVPGAEHSPWFQNVHWSDPPALLVDQGRRMALSLSHRLCLCRGELVNTMVRAGMGHYVEFRALDAAFIHLDKDGAAATRPSSYPHASLCKVPCAKRDVFQSKVRRGGVSCDLPVHAGA